jgi:hypothetical protein
MLEKTAQLSAEKKVGKGENLYALYGLDHPSNKITVTAGSVEKVITLGDANSATGDYYMSVEGKDDIYTVDSTFYNLFSNSILKMASRETLPGILVDDIMSFSVDCPDGRILFEKSLLTLGEDNNSTGAWTVQEQNGAVMEADPEQVTLVLTQVMKLRYEEMTAYQPTKEELDFYGLSDPEAVLEMIYMKDHQKKYVIRIGLEADDFRYVYAENGQGIYKVKSSSLDPLLHLSSDDFLSLYIAPVKPEELQKIEISWESGHIEFEKRMTDGKQTRYYCNGNEIEQREFNSFSYPLYAFAAEKRVSDVSDQLKQESALTLKYTRMSGTKEDLFVEMIPYDQNYYAAKVNGKAVLLVNRQKVNGLMEEWNQYLEK